MYIETLMLSSPLWTAILNEKLFICNMLEAVTMQKHNYAFAHDYIRDKLFGIYARIWNETMLRSLTIEFTTLPINIH